MWRVERDKISGQGCNLFRRKVLAVGRHVPATLDDLAYELRLSLYGSDRSQVWATMATLTVYCVTVPALVILEDQRAL